MAYKRKTYRKTYRRSAPKKRKTYKSKRRAAPRSQKLVIQIAGLPTGSMVSTATLGKKSGRPVYARF